MRASRIAVVLFVSALSLSAQAPANRQKAPEPPQSAQATPAGAGKTAAEQFKNIQVLKTVPAEDLVPAMRYVAASLGVQCGFCHVMEPQRAFDKDDKKEKQTAREMMKMVMAINQESFEGRQEVSCNSCHNGHSRPQIVPPVATEASMKQEMQERANQRPAAGAQPGQAPAPETRPSAESLFQKYEQAIGGSDAVNKITTLYTKGSVAMPMGSASFEQYNKAPDKFWEATTTQRGERVQAWDGAQGWTKTGRVEPMRDTTEAKAEADFYRSLKFAGRYRGARVFRKEKVGDRDAWVVMARIPDSPLTDMLYFDVDSGLLLRRTTLRRTALGPFPTSYDFDDYRDVSGVKMPFKVTVATPGSLQTIQVSEMKANVPVEDTRFEMPKDEKGQ